MKKIVIGILACVVMLLSACGTQQPEPMESKTLSIPSAEEHKEERTASSISRPESSKRDTASTEESQDDLEGPSSSPEAQAQNTTAPAVSSKPSETPGFHPSDPNSSIGCFRKPRAPSSFASRNGDAARSGIPTYSRT